MIRIQETIRPLPFYRPVPLTRLPLLYHREHLFPYPSYGDTEATPVSRDWRLVSLENEYLRVEVAPELGGRVYSLLDKRIGRELLFRNPVVKPVRILPIGAFISGGLEFNFPIAHSPTSLAEVGCATGQVDDYGYVRVGEREARTGMEWVVELGLRAGSPVLVQRTALRNGTGADHPWMLWTICAVRSSVGTEFIHPPHRVLRHDDRLAEADWPGEGLNWDRYYEQMTALFWKPGSAPHFGVFHHELGFGLMHLANPAQLPGKKVWTYGHGRHRGWSRATTVGDRAYAELESGPLMDQSEKPLFARGTEWRGEEFWIPVHKREACDRVDWPDWKLPPWDDPWLGWQHSAWQTEWEQFRAEAGPLPDSPVVTGIDLEAALRRAVARGHDAAREPLAQWLAFHGRPAEALALVQQARTATAQRLAGLICWKGLADLPRGLPHLEAGPLQDAVAVIELDEAYAQLGLTAKRVDLLARAPIHRLVIERLADLALVRGQPREAIRLLTDTPWPREHQRYVRSELWRRANAALGHASAAVPDFLNEDTLAPFGAYWSDA